MRGANEETPAGALSGGNQQKVQLSRELTRPARLIIAEQPSQGVDIGAIESIHRTLVAMRDEGRAVFVISADLDELLSLCDRILVIYRGRIVGDVPADNGRCGAHRTIDGRARRDHRSRGGAAYDRTGRSAGIDTAAPAPAALFSRASDRRSHLIRARRPAYGGTLGTIPSRSTAVLLRRRSWRLAESCCHVADDDPIGLYRTGRRGGVQGRHLEYRRRRSDADGSPRGRHRGLRVRPARAARNAGLYPRRDPRRCRMGGHSGTAQGLRGRQRTRCLPHAESDRVAVDRLRVGPCPEGPRADQQAARHHRCCPSDQLYTLLPIEHGLVPRAGGLSYLSSCSTSATVTGLRVEADWSECAVCQLRRHPRPS